MEIVIQILLIDFDEVLFSLDGVIWRFPDNVLETGGIVIDSCPQETILEVIVISLTFIFYHAHNDIIVIPRHNRSLTIQMIKR